MKKYTVKQLAKIANISPRTLRHYDQIGLLKPAQIGDNGYRYYQHDQLIQLMQILFYKELDFSLEEINQIIHDPSFNLNQALVDHKTLLQLKTKRNQRLIKTINQILTANGGTTPMNPQKSYKSFFREEINQYKDEVKARWGNTDAYRQSMERYKKWTESDLQRIKTQGDNITQSLANSTHLGISNPQVQQLIKQHHAYIGNFYDCSIHMYCSLGEMYFADPRFANNYNHIKPGLAKFVSDAIAYYCDHQATKS